MQDRQRQLKAFTLIELLTVVAVISMLIMIFSVGTRKVTIIGRGLQQKSVFHAMEVGLELFSGDFEAYPESAVRDASGVKVTGAQHVVEALLGRDEQGFEPRTGWYPPNDKLYRADAPADLYTNTVDSLARRKGPYFDLKYGSVSTIYELWDSNTGPSAIYDSTSSPTPPQRSPVITDVFERNETPNGRRGMPILYFKADPAKVFRIDPITRQTVDIPTPSDYRQWTYNFEDNRAVLELPWLRDPSQGGGLDSNIHYQDPDDTGKTPAQLFYELITKPGADPDRGFFRPYNERTFILISAGWDGIFGTKDDIVNFD